MTLPMGNIRIGPKTADDSVYNIIYLNLCVLSILKYLQNCNENVPVLPRVLQLVILGLTQSKSRGEIRY